MNATKRISSGLRALIVRKLLALSSKRVSLPEFGTNSEISVIRPISSSPSSELQILVKELVNILPITVLDELEDRCREVFGNSVVNHYPGEHYRLLSALVSVLDAKYVIEIGTFQGLGTLALLNGSKICKVETFDIVPWSSLQSQVLRPDDFIDGRLVQSIVDLSWPAAWESNKARFLQADVIFLDGPKDGLFEEKFLDFLVPYMRGSNCLLVIDDIRTLPMIKLWNDLDLDKFDLTSIAHWSGTGIARL